MCLSWILLVTAVCVACGQTVSCAQWQFDEMITCTQPKVNPLIYNRYGCNCVFYGTHSPKDKIDQCCAVQNECYAYARKVKKCSGDQSMPYNKVYNYICSAKAITCPSSNNDHCQYLLCDCDRVAANCLAQYQHTYNNNYKNLPKDTCKK